MVKISIIRLMIYVACLGAAMAMGVLGFAVFLPVFLIGFTRLEYRLRKAVGTTPDFTVRDEIHWLFTSCAEGGAIYYTAGIAAFCSGGLALFLFSGLFAPSPGRQPLALYLAGLMERQPLILCVAGLMAITGGLCAGWLFGRKLWSEPAAADRVSRDLRHMKYSDLIDFELDVLPQFHPPQEGECGSSSPGPTASSGPTSSPPS